MNTQVAAALADYRSRLGPAEPNKARTGRWRWWLVGVLAVLVLTGGAWVWRGSEQPSNADRSAETALGAAPWVPGEDQSRIATAAPAADPVPLTAGPAATWRSDDALAVGTWLPQSQTSGPRDSRLGALSGFAQTPQGALLAAANLYPAIYYTRDRESWQSLADHRVIWAAGGRASLWSALEPVWSIDTRGAVLRPLGFRMVTYSPRESRVRLWWRSEIPGRAPLPVGAIATVRWVDGDWWLVFDEASMDMRPADPARDTYVPWAPEEQL